MRKYILFCLTHIYLREKCKEASNRKFFHRRKSLKLRSPSARSLNYEYFPAKSYDDNVDFLAVCLKLGDTSPTLLVKLRGRQVRKGSMNSLGCLYIKYGVAPLLFLLQASLSGGDMEQSSGNLKFPKGAILKI